MLFYLVVLGPVAILFTTIFSQVLINRRRKAKYTEAFKDKMLRPPGESLRVQIRDLDLEIDSLLMFCMIGISVGIFGGVIIHNHVLTDQRPLALLFPGCVSLVSTSIACYRFLKIVPKRRNLQTGYDGECLTGQYLNRLMLDGYNVYHDLVFDNYNIDHLVVGKTGIFVFETKTRRKLTKHGRERARVTYNGKELVYPGFRDNHGIEQAKRNALDVKQWLSNYLGQPVEARPILCLPGWFIESNESHSVEVLNPKSVASKLSWIGNNLPEEKKLDDVLVKRICNRIEEMNVTDNT